ncbi:MAG: class I SAM-dependent methyltransferase [Pseudomonadota bacterium]|nr:class I SAM-dependent methyltransferase [Pseudomonadota bacterium]
MTGSTCRSCGATLNQTFVDLGETPLANSYPGAAELDRPDRRYPLHARVCQDCFLVQVDAVVPSEEIFSDYAYFSSYSESWVDHARRFTEIARRRFALDSQSLVVEVASNDGYLLRHFVDAGVPVLGVEPAANVAVVAEAAGVPTAVRFFGRETAADLVADGKAADLVVGNNVLAHVPDLNDFVAGLGALLKPGGVVSLEFPHLLRLMEEVQFDTIYHEHFSYFSLIALEPVLARHGLRLFDVDTLATHGGSLRLYACHADCEGHQEGPGLDAVRGAERDAGLGELSTFTGFAARVATVKDALRAFLETAKSQGKTVVAYGAAAKGNTLLNTCGIGTDLIEYVVDASPHKQGRYLSGSRLPIVSPERLAETKPNYVLILPWNLRHEIIGQNPTVGDWGGRFVVPIPITKVLP